MYGIFENKYLVYMIGAMQGVFEDPEGHKTEFEWRKELKSWAEKLNLPIIWLDPIEMEEQKTGDRTQILHEKWVGWKKSGHHDLYVESGSRIWWGTPTCWGDYDCVVHAAFIIGYGSNSYISPGTHKELGVAEYHRVPVLWVSPDNMSDVKDSTHFGAILSGGGLYQNFNQVKREIIKRCQLLGWNEINKED